MEQGKPLQDGGIYVCRHGKLEELPRAPDDGMRRIRITDDAYQAAMDLVSPAINNARNSFWLK